MKSTLAIANHASWQGDPLYSRTMADVLSQAQATLERARKGQIGYRAVLETLRSWQYTVMAPKQLKRVHYMLGFAHGALQEYAAAIEHDSLALEIARRMRTHYEPDAALNSYELLYLRASHYRAVGRYADASRDLRLALTLLDEFIPEDSEELPALQLRLFAQLAQYAFFQGQYDASEHAIASARKLLPLAPELHYEAAAVAWAEAHLARTLGTPERALQSATAALPHIAHTNVLTQVRFHAFLASVALDGAERRLDVKHTREFDLHIRTARRHVRIADALAIKGEDVSGALLAWLIRMRQYRFAGRNYDRVADIERLMRQGQRIGDDALLVQAMVSLGDEFAFLRLPEAALSWYRQAIGTSDGSQQPILALPALRKVLTAEEWRAEH